MNTWNQMTGEMMKTWGEAGTQVFQNWLELMGLKRHADEDDSSSKPSQAPVETLHTQVETKHDKSLHTPSEDEIAKDLMIAQLQQELILLQKQLEQEQKTNQVQRLELQQQGEIIANLEQQIKQLQSTAISLEQQMGELQSSAAIGSRYLDKWRYRNYTNR